MPIMNTTYGKSAEMMVFGFVLGVAFFLTIYSFDFNSLTGNFVKTNHNALSKCHYVSSIPSFNVVCYNLTDSELSEMLSYNNITVQQSSGFYYFNIPVAELPLSFVNRD